ncbi:uncharacterized protein N7459_001189 [Penicillium hispanicum]|uniref:uncharacterized protein n=1 Tax=Penicillium hispanicum TaxID=1080232 RepID=UPI0025425BD6|nr:uncharacterized protein N7459_001189 [Penicillium hispanicum]KAJ5594981.1 hypothetical protein N7459_001189 [Penicillium hispanicum]
MTNSSSTMAAQHRGADPLAEADERRLRKRAQNRLNQRARRMRLQGPKSQEKTARNPFQVHRWRLDLDEAPLALTKPKQSDNFSHHNQHFSESHSSSNDFVSELESDSPFVLASESTCKGSYRLAIPPSLNQLLSLIQFNVFRGLYTNKIALGRRAVAWSPGREPEAFDVSFPASSVLLPIAPGLPGSLDPTQSQRSQVHSAWINMLPFPKMRENMIRWESSFDHSEFANDIIGNILDPVLFFSQPVALASAGPMAQRRLIMSGTDDELTADRNGLIIWGEPYSPDSWEVTPGFLRKWAWVMEGCEELIESSNRWRRIRGEDPLRFSLST